MIFKEIMSFNFKAKLVIFLFQKWSHTDNNTKKSFVDQKNEFKSLNYETLLMSLPLKGKYPNEG